MRGMFSFLFLCALFNFLVLAPLRLQRETFRAVVPAHP